MTTWDVSSPLPGGAWSQSCYGGGLYVTVEFGTDRVQFSADGLTWYGATLPESKNWYGLAWNGSLFCLVYAPGSTCYTSPDGITWTSRSLGASGYWSDVASVGGGFVAIAEGTPTYARSSDGVTWTIGTLPIDAYRITCSDDMYVATGLNQTATSIDGVSWTAGTSWATSVLFEGGWNSPYFLLVDSNASPASNKRSTDGLVWEDVSPTGGTYHYGPFVAAGRFFVTVDGDSTVYESTDGVSWSSSSAPSGNWISAAVGPETMLLVSITGGYVAMANLVPPPVPDFWTDFVDAKEIS